MKTIKLCVKPSGIHYKPQGDALCFVKACLLVAEKVSHTEFVEEDKGTATGSTNSIKYYRYTCRYIILFEGYL